MFTDVVLRGHSTDQAAVCMGARQSEGKEMELEMRREMDLIGVCR